MGFSIEKKTRMIRYICPNNCGNFRMLNPGVSLALCQKPGCGCIQMILADRPSIKLNSLRKKNIPFACDRCEKGSKEGIHLLTLVDNRKKAICDGCLKTHIPTTTWTYPSKNSKG